MNKIIITLIAPLILQCNIDKKTKFYSTHRSKEENITIDSSPKVLTLEIDNSDPSKIGFIETKEDLTIGITSLCIVDSFIYLTDEFHKNVKRVDILTSNIVSSKRITTLNRFKQFNDIIEFNNKIYITSSSNIIYIVSKDLNTSSSFKLPSLDVYPTYVVNKSDSTLEFYAQFCDSAYTINLNNEIIKKRELPKSEVTRYVNYFDIKLGNIRYKNLMYTKDDDKESFIVGQDTIKLIEPFKYSAEAYNVDFSDKYLAIFSINSKEFKLYIYSLEKHL